MRILQVVPQIGLEASGPSYSVRALCEAVARQGADVTLHVLRMGNTPEVEGVRVVLHDVRPRQAQRLGPSPTLCRSLAADAVSADILHTHSLWMLPNVYPARAVRDTRCRLVVSPRGTFSPVALSRSPWMKPAFYGLLQRDVIELASCLHATSDQEADQIRALGIRTPIAVIPNGIELPEARDRFRSPGHRRRLLFLGRLHPIKGVDLLLQAWCTLQSRFPDWELRIVGPDERGYGAQMAALAAELGAERVSFPGPAFGDAKWQEYADADLFVLPTHSENFGMAVVEALASGLPAVVSKGAPWHQLDEQRCGWWIDVGVEALADCLLRVLALPEATLDEMGARGRDWARDHFGWDRIGRMMFGTYAWILDGGVPPVWVRTD